MVDASIVVDAAGHITVQMTIKWAQFIYTYMFNK